MFEKAIYKDVIIFNILVAVLVLLAAIAISKLIVLYLKRTLRDRMNKEHLEILSKTIFYGLLVIALLWILPYIGVDLSGLLVAGGILGIALGFASQSIVGNLISGLFIMGERPIKIGDLVEVAGNTGFVEDIKIISTAIRSFEGTCVRIPNEIVFTSNLTNFWTHPVRRIEYEIRIRYSDDADRAINVILETIETEPLILVEPQPHAFVDNLGNNGVNIIIRFWVPSPDWYQVKTEMLWKIKKAVEREGIQIPFPQRVIWYGASDKGD